MSKQTDLQTITDYLDKMTIIRSSKKDKITAYQQKILQLLVREKTTEV